MNSGYLALVEVHDLQEIDANHINFNVRQTVQLKHYPYK